MSADETTHVCWECGAFNVPAELPRWPPGSPRGVPACHRCDCPADRHRPITPEMRAAYALGGKAAVWDIVATIRQAERDQRKS